MANQSLWGIDLGGTKIEGAILEGNVGGVPPPRVGSDRVNSRGEGTPPTTPTAHHRMRLPTEGDRGYEHVVGQIVRLVEQLEAASGTRRPAVIGFGTPGTTEPSTGKLKNSNTVCLNGRTLGADVSAKLGVEARLANDANCFALAEATMGAAKGRSVVVGLILGTGVGGGVVVDGKVLNGKHGIAGEWGHNPICGETTPCYCGRKGCVETVIAGPALERFYAGRRGEKLRLPQIVSRAAGGDGDAAATLERLRDKFGEAIAAVINILDPDAIVIGGGVGNIDLLYEEQTRQAVLRSLFNPELKTEFLRPQLGDSAGVFGAALLAQ